MEDKEWVLNNVEDICADTRVVDEVCIALEHSTIFATDMIQNLTQTMFDLQQEYKKQKELIDKIKEQISLYLDIAYSSEETFVRIEDLEYILMLMEII